MPETPRSDYLEIPLQADPQYDYHITALEELNSQLSSIGSSLLRFAASLARTDATRPPHLQDLVEKGDIVRAAELLFGSAIAHQPHLPQGDQYAGTLSQQPTAAAPEAKPVFMSYASEDGAVFAKRLIANLKRHGLECFFAERSIPTASDWRDEIWNAMAGCRVVVLIVTPCFTQSHWCPGEVGAALSHNRTIVPVLRPGGRVPETVEGLQAMIVETPAEMRNLIRLLKKMCAPRRDA